MYSISFCQSLSLAYLQYYKRTNQVKVPFKSQDSSKGDKHNGSCMCHPQFIRICNVVSFSSLICYFADEQSVDGTVPITLPSWVLVSCPRAGGWVCGWLLVDWCSCNVMVANLSTRVHFDTNTRYNVVFKLIFSCCVISHWLFGWQFAGSGEEMKYTFHMSLCHVVCCYLRLTIRSE